MYVAPAAGGAPRQLQPDFFDAAYPVWSPDGKHLLFLGHRDDKLPPKESVDWWVTPLEPGPTVRTWAFEATRREKLSGPVAYYPWALVPAAWEPAGDSLIFSARSGDSTNLWRIGISPETWKVTDAPRRLTSGPTLEEKPAVASAPGAAVRVAFTTVTENVDIWSLPVAANQGKVAGEPRQLTHDAAADFHPALSPDGSKMVFISAQTGSQEIWIKDLRSGEESALTATRSEKYAPLFSPDGSRVSF
jgi:Tol biopolymer transport system component